ncbi:unnamed protein product [Tetraodon nigroviridis]|uniref:(spotted green pufferfish) hypothetical protein n=1 Tax=Tetraodon nigroviridis TaxID=99883 RepID=Q4RIP9_TETNG|nr:unnamed protein product [Tetraodon nigroviridis]
MSEVADTRRLNSKPQDLMDAYGPPSNFLEIDVNDPQIVGVGRNRYTVYKVRMKTNLPIFKLKDSCVKRRYSDFEWLKSELERDSKIVVPALPGKALKRQLPFRPDEGLFEESFIEERRVGPGAVHQQNCGSPSGPERALSPHVPAGGGHRPRLHPRKSTTLGGQGATGRPIGVYFYSTWFERLLAEAELSKSGEIDIPGLQKTRSSHLFTVVSSFSPPVTLLCGPKSAFRSLQFLGFFWPFFSQSRATCSMFQTDGNVPLNICRFTQRACEFVTLISHFCSFLG